MAASFAQSGSSQRWKDWEFLLGEWVGEGSGKPGEATGGFSFQRELDGQVLMRKNRADYPAHGQRPATSHEDLMVIYPKSAGKGTRAIYFDNEGHVINYSVAFSNDKKVLTFLSDEGVPGPRFRLTYTKVSDGVVEVAFEMAPPGRQEFTPYTKGTARRK